MKRDDTVYLNHILDAIARTQVYLQDVNETLFYATPLIQDGVIRQIEIIGEATKRLSEGLRRQYKQVPWDDIAGMRDKLVHDYFGVDTEKVWLTAMDDLPVLKVNVEVILRQIKS
ncbi:MAG: DUF86 domain-containing protein [Chloroflexi bacterium]|nr:DUF86 domain-containing protein [Chloroflexota bacterium]